MLVASVYLIYIFAQLLIKQYVIVDFDVFVSCKYLAHCLFCVLFVTCIISRTVCSVICLLCCISRTVCDLFFTLRISHTACYVIFLLRVVSHALFVL